MQANVENEYDLLSDFDTREEARRRMEYYQYVDKLEATIKKDKIEIEQLKKQINELKNMKKG